MFPHQFFRWGNNGKTFCYFCPKLRLIAPFIVTFRFKFLPINRRFPRIPAPSTAKTK